MVMDWKNPSGGKRMHTPSGIPGETRGSGKHFSLRPQALC